MGMVEEEVEEEVDMMEAMTGRRGWCDAVWKYFHIHFPGMIDLHRPDLPTERAGGKNRRLRIWKASSRL